VDCTHVRWVADRDWIRQFTSRIANERIPISGSLNLTHRCNLKCTHCYHPEPGRGEAGKELPTRQILCLIDEIQEAGCLYLLITGGEPMLRPDFIEVYQHAKQSGLITTVFTNATLVTDQVLDVFSDFPPQGVEISVYGFTPETHDEITGVHGSFERTWKGIRALRDRNINTTLKMILMRNNLKEFSDLHKASLEIGAKFRFDAAIFPRLNGDQTPVELRISPADAVNLEFSEKKWRDQWVGYLERFKDVVLDNSLFNCGAGRTTFNIDSSGCLTPCLMINDVRFNLRKGNFEEGWEEIGQSIRAKKVEKEYYCNNCVKRSLCGFCPAFFKLETGSENMYCEYLCKLGHLRYERCQEMTGGG